MRDALIWAAPPPEAFATGHSAAPVQRHNGEQAVECLVEEAPISLVFNEQFSITLMATPLQAEALALGFCLSEGLVERADEVQALEAVPAGAGLAVLVQLPAERLAALQARRRFGSVPGGCGLCGMEDQAAVLALPAPAVRTLVLSEHAVAHALAALTAHQALNASTGGAHAAALFNADGQLLHWAEDVSRHCALDKVIGLQREGFGRTWALVSSRASYELVAKGARVGLPLLAAMSAPTALAQRAAQRAGLELLAFVREGRWSRYSA
jgi:FdhD protein